MLMANIITKKPHTYKVHSENKSISILTDSKESFGCLDNSKIIDAFISPQASHSSTYLSIEKKKRQKSSTPLETFLSYKKLQENNVILGYDSAMFYFPPIIDNVAKSKEKNEKTFCSFVEMELKGKNTMNTKYKNKRNISLQQNEYDKPSINNDEAPNEKNHSTVTKKAVKWLDNTLSVDYSNTGTSFINSGKKKDLLESNLKYNREQLEAIRQFNNTQRLEEFEKLAEDIFEEEDRHNRMPPVKKYKGRIFLYNREQSKKEISVNQHEKEKNDSSPTKNNAKIKEKKPQLLNQYSFATSNKCDCYWYNNEQNGWKPELRESCTFTLWQGKGYLYGGIGKKVFEDWCACDLSSKALTWNKIAVAGDEPAYGRFGHSAIAFQGKIFIFGGEKKFNSQIKQRECLSDVRIFHTEKSQWRYIKPTGDIIEARRNHAATSFGKFMLISGGINYRYHYLNDYLAYDMSLNKWLNLLVKPEEGLNMPGLSFHACCSAFNRNRNMKNINLYQSLETISEHVSLNPIQIEGVYIFGGKNSSNICINDLYILLIDQKPMKLIKPETKGMLPNPRCSHSLIYCEEINGVVCYGGRVDSVLENPFYSDVHILNLRNLEWIKVNLGGIKVPPRGGHCASTDGSRMIVFGGLNMNGLVKGDINILELDFSQAEKLIKYEKANNRYSSLENREVKSPDPVELPPKIPLEVVEEKQSKNVGFKNYKTLIESLDFKNFYSLVPLPGPEKNARTLNEVIQKAPEFRSIPSFIHRPSQILRKSFSKFGESGDSFAFRRTETGDKSPTKKRV